MTQLIRIADLAGASGFAEDKDSAKTIRMGTLLPALERGDHIVLDFKKVQFATQSFMHALIGEAIKKHGEGILDRIEFKNCSTQLKSLIQLVVDYSLGGFSTQEHELPVSRSARS